MLALIKYMYNHHWWIPYLALNDLWVFSAHTQCDCTEYDHKMISKYHHSFKYLKYEVLLIYFKLLSVANPFDIPINLLWCAIYTSSPEQNWRVMLVSEKWGFRYSRTKKSCIWCGDSIVRCGDSNLKVCVRACVSNESIFTGFYALVTVLREQCD